MNVSTYTIPPILYQITYEAPGNERMLDNMYTMAHLATIAGARILLNTKTSKERIESLAPDYIMHMVHMALLEKDCLYR